MKEYEIAAHKFYSLLKINSLPISSWDIFSIHFNKLCLEYNDVLVLSNIAETNQWTHSLDLERYFIEEKQIIVVTDADLNIVHATQNIYAMNGYRPTEILGKKPKIFQGEGTSKETIAYISNAVRNKISFDTTIVNYRKDGSIYNCHIKGSPIFNDKGKLVNFIAYEREVA